MYLWFIFTNTGFVYIFHICLIHNRNYSGDKRPWREAFTVSYSRRVKLAPLIPNFSPNPQGSLYCLLLRSTFLAFVDEVLQIFPCLLTVDKLCPFGFSWRHWPFSAQCLSFTLSLHPCFVHVLCSLQCLFLPLSGRTVQNWKWAPRDDWQERHVQRWLALCWLDWLTASYW